MYQYWVVGAFFGGSEDHFEEFTNRGYWYLDHDDEDQLDQSNLRNQMQADDRIAIKKMLGQGSSEIEIRAIGIIKEIDPEDKRVYVDWLYLFDEGEKIVESKGAYKAVNGPFTRDNWTDRVFSI